MLASGRAAVLALLFALGVSGCVSVYHARDRGAEDGYSERQLEATRWRVEYVGDEIASREQVDNFLLLRAAEVTLASGYEWFTPSEHESEAQEELVVTGARREHPAVWRPMWRERHGRFHWTDWMEPGASPHDEEAEAAPRSYTVQRYAAREEILLGRGQRPDEAFDAQSVITRLAPERQRTRR